MKKYFTLFSLVLVLFLTGCSRDMITPETHADGWFDSLLVYPLSHFITYVAELLNGDYGLAIIVVTLIVRFAVMPLMLGQMKSTMKMQLLQPQLKELQQKYSSKDTATQQKLQQEMMALYKENGVNPLAGCLPLLIQMPILMAFYYAISRTQAITEHSFLWVELGSKDPTFMLPILAALTTFISMKISNMGTIHDPNNAMASQMKMMMYISPALILFSGTALPSALSLYWAVGGLVSIAQALIILNMKKKHKEEHGL